MTQIFLVPKSVFLIMLHNGSKGKEGTISPSVFFYSGRLHAGRAGSAARLDCSSGRGDSHLANSWGGNDPDCSLHPSLGGNISHTMIAWQVWSLRCKESLE